MFWLLIGLFSLQLIVVLLLFIGFGRTHRPDPEIGILQSENRGKGLSVIIPFCNEEQRILPLIESINQAHLPDAIEFIFVDDGSTDKTYSVISSNIRTPFKLIRNEGRPGKKGGVQTAVRQANYSHIITLDADVSFSPLYLIEAACFNQDDLTIFPVRMKGGNFVQQVGSFEFSFLQLLTFGLAGYGQPLLCNGANLGFRRSTYLELDPDRDDYGVASGDDIFLLREMKKQQKHITAISNTSVLVTTQRWFGKMAKMMNIPSFLSIFLLISIQIGFFLSFFGLKSSFVFFLPLGIKLVAEWLTDMVMVRGISPLRLLMLIIHQFWYPLYLILLLIPVKREERWVKSN